MNLFSVVRISAKSPMCGLVSNQAGSSAIEYAIFLGILMGAIVAVGSAVGLSMRGTFEQLGGLTERSEIARKAEPFQKDPAADARKSQTEKDALLARQLIAIATLLCFGLVVWYLLYCRHQRQPITHHEQQALQALDREVDQDAIFAKRQEILHKLSENLPAVVAGHVQIGDLMSRHLVTVTPETHASEVRNLMRVKRVRHLVVCTIKGELQGIISIKDLQNSWATTAACLMTKSVLTVEPTALLDPTITLLLHNRISCLPVVKNHQLFGIFTTTDALMTLQCISHLVQKLACDKSPTH